MRTLGARVSGTYIDVEFLQKGVERVLAVAVIPLEINFDPT